MLAGTTLASEVVRGDAVRCPPESLSVEAGSQAVVEHVILRPEGPFAVLHPGLLRVRLFRGGIEGAQDDVQHQQDDQVDEDRLLVHDR